MQQHFINIDSLQTSGPWAVHLIKTNWELIFQIWEHRNQHLHYTDRIKELEGSSELYRAVRRELKIGIGSLPVSGFSQYFKFSSGKQLLSKDI